MKVQAELISGEFYDIPRGAELYKNQLLWDSTIFTMVPPGSSIFLLEVNNITNLALVNYKDYVGWMIISLIGNRIDL